jgi:hypothetical protein
MSLNQVVLERADGLIEERLQTIFSARSIEP